MNAERAVAEQSPLEPSLVVEAGRVERQYWRDLMDFRGLFIFLAWRDIMVRYKQTVIGVAWAVLRPVLLMVVFTVVFGKFARLDSGGVPYPILVFAAMLPWQFFATGLAECSNSLVSNANLVAKIYFPRIILPASSVIVALVDFLIACVVLAGMMVYYRFQPGWGVLLLPFLVAVTFAAAMAGGIWFASLNVRYRDFRHIVPFVVQIGMYLSPVGFRSDIVPGQWRFLYSLNPMVGVIDGFRWALLGGDFQIYWPGFLLSLAAVAVLLATGIHYFRKTERTFADVI